MLIHEVMMKFGRNTGQMDAFYENPIFGVSCVTEFPAQPTQEIIEELSTEFPFFQNNLPENISKNKREFICFVLQPLKDITTIEILEWTSGLNGIIKMSERPIHPSGKPPVLLFESEAEPQKGLSHRQGESGQQGLELRDVAIRAAGHTLKVYFSYKGTITFRDGNDVLK